jgi:hypothetical protein
MRAISTSSWDQPNAGEPFVFECQSMDSRRAQAMEVM